MRDEGYKIQLAFCDGKSEKKDATVAKTVLIGNGETPHLESGGKCGPPVCLDVKILNVVGSRRRRPLVRGVLEEARLGALEVGSRRLLRLDRLSVTGLDLETSKSKVSKHE